MRVEKLKRTPRSLSFKMDKVNGHIQATSLRDEHILVVFFGSAVHGDTELQKTFPDLSKRRVCICVHC